jgi:Flp pilus assembly protein TadG
VPSSPRGRGERGTVLMMVPAGFLVLLILAAITFDYSHLFLAQRELSSVAEAAANDAVTYGVDQGRLRAGEGAHLDPNRVDVAVQQALAAHGRDLTIIDARAVTVSDTRVEVTLIATIEYVFVKAMPGSPKTATITVHSAAEVP